MNKFLILMCYFNRPNLVKLALQSVKDQKNKNWEIVFVDDGSEVSALESCKEILGDDFEKLTYVNTNTTVLEKQQKGGSIFGRYWSEACVNTDCNIGFMLCDDDALFPDYLDNLDTYFSNNQGENWCYSYYKGYDPFVQTKMYPLDNIVGSYNSPQFTHRIQPSCTVDASQVAFRLRAFKENGVRFAYPLTANLDADIYTKLTAIYGDCPFSGFYSQYKSTSNSCMIHNYHSMYMRNFDIGVDPLS